MAIDSFEWIFLASDAWVMEVRGLRGAWVQALTPPRGSRLHDHSVLLDYFPS